MDVKITRMVDQVITVEPRGNPTKIGYYYFESTLNPYAMEWEPRTNRAPEEDRCLFLTFSNGHPLTHRQIARFFTEKYGPCVEKVYVQQNEQKKKPPLFGKVIFNKSAIPAMLMGGETQVKFIVDKKPLWCKRFHLKNNVYGIVNTNKYFY